MERLLPASLTADFPSQSKHPFDMEPSHSCPLGHSRGKAIIDAIISVQQRLQHKDEGGHSSARLRQLEQKLDLVTEVLVSSVRELKDLEASRRNSQSEDSSSKEMLPLKDKIAHLIGYMEDEVKELTGEVKKSEIRLRRLTRPEDINDEKERLVSLKRLCIKKQQQVLEMKSFLEVLKRQDQAKN